MKKRDIAFYVIAFIFLAWLFFWPEIHQFIRWIVNDVINDPKRI